MKNTYITTLLVVEKRIKTDNHIKKKKKTVIFIEAM